MSNHKAQLPKFYFSCIIVLDMSGFIDSRPSFSHIHPEMSASAVVTITAKMLKAVSGWRWLVADWCAAPSQQISDDRLQWPDYRLLTTGPGRAKGNKGETGCWPILPICTMLTTLLAYSAIYLYTIYTMLPIPPLTTRLDRAPTHIWAGGAYQTLGQASSPWLDACQSDLLQIKSED